MKKVSYILLVLLTMTSFMMVSCDGLLNADSERYTFEEDYRMSSEHDSLYSIVGILTQLQKLGDRYVLLGELRGDLMQTNDDASLYLKQIQEFTITEDNPYASIKEYYAIINNCNYTIQEVDTAIGTTNDKPFYRVMAAAKSIRAWTYMQLVLNYGSAKYIENPILTADDAEKTYDVLDLTQMADALIEDLLPFKDIEPLALGSFESFDSKLSIFPIYFLLGDLYLLKEDYENAAKMYYELMFTQRLIIQRLYASEWEFLNNVKSTGTLRWHQVFSPQSTEILGAIASSPDYGSPFTLDSLSYHYTIGPTDLAIKNWTSAMYYYDIYAQSEGDMRGYASYYNPYSTLSLLNSGISDITEPIITKYLDMCTETEKRIVIYRNSLLYLRYAEAVNRLGYPLLAFAVIKSGLNPITTRSGALAKEIGYTTGTVLPYMNFSDFRFSTSYGIRMRGLGNVNNDTTFFKIPSSVDTIEFVEDKIVEELALEMAFEGNRFQDLVRVAKRRINPAYLADRVSAKYTTNKAAMHFKLSDPDNWYLPK